MATDQLLSFPGGYQVGQPAPAPVLFARPSSDTPRKPSPYEDLLDKLIRGGQSGHGGVGSEEDFGPTPFDTYTYLRNKAAGGPSQMDMQAGEAGINAQSAQDLLERLRTIPTSQREMLTAPDYPTLNLPVPPQRHKAQPEPVSALAAGLLGLVSPQYAGQFGAAVTHGALEANERQYGDDQQKYAQDFQRMQVMHADDLRRINAQNEIANENKGIAYANSIAREKGLREEATAANNASRLTGISKYLSDIAPKADEASRYGVQADIALEQHKEDVRRQENREKRFLSAAELKARLDETSAMREATLAETKRYHDIQSNRPVVIPGGSSFYNPGTGEVTKGPDKQFAPDKGKWLDIGDGFQNSVTGQVIPHQPKTRAGQTLKASDPRYAALWSDYILKNRAIQHDTDSLRSPNIQDDEKAAIRKRITQNATEMNAIKSEMDQREAAVTVSKKGGVTEKTAPTTARKQFRDPSGSTFWAHVENGKWVRE